MIGVIGSDDSVGHIVAVAKGAGLSDQLIARSYTDPADAARLAAEIDGRCDTLLFTGRVPYDIAMAELELTATALYVRYSALDLYRTLVIIALDAGGRLPRLSIDTIDRQTVEETFHEVGVRPPADLYPLGNSTAKLPNLASAMADFHRKAFRGGSAELCVTCMSAVRDELAAEGIPVVRVRTTDSSVRESLGKATMASQLQRSEWAQVAVLAVTGPESGDAGIESAEQEIARLLSGRIVGDEARVIVTTRGALERELRREPLHRVWSLLDAIPAWLGVGFGDSLPQAEQNSRYALSVAAVTKAHQEVFPDGSMRKIADPPDSTPLHMRNTSERLQALLESGRISRLTLSRLQAAIAALGREDITARELADEYGVEPRSARRLLAALHRAGIAEPLGAQAAPRAGRPQVVYRVHLKALLEVDAPVGNEAPNSRTVVDD